MWKWNEQLKKAFSNDDNNVIKHIFYEKGINFKNNNNQTFLHIVVRNNNFKMVEYLIKNNANLDIKDKWGNTPLFDAQNNDNVEIFNLLVKNNANLSIENKEGQKIDQILELEKKSLIREYEKFCPDKMTLGLSSNFKLCQWNIIYETTNNVSIKKIINKITAKEKMLNIIDNKVKQSLNDINSTDLHNQPSTSGYNSSRETFKIYNVFHDEYLYAASDYFAHDSERRSVYTWREGTSVNQGNWELKKVDNNEYRIYNVFHDEYLYAASDYFAHDSERRSVYTWREGTSVNQGNWKLKKVENNEYRIYNVFHDEYLYAASDYFAHDSKRRSVYTWREGTSVNQGNWKLYSSNEPSWNENFVRTINQPKSLYNQPSTSKSLQM
ncbi:MAG: hypothetical protein PPFGHCPK_01463 (plasmid) [Spiroplasma endosymbiont of Drosophila atripex]|nr:MAG: hypothetical protein PPFGHCPK_01463 [Spiroplasma endosymbiont of Drosophila atripex]